METDVMETGFAELAAPYRRELLAHCYRMLGSADDAEDAVQETYLRAWRAYGGFDGRASLRTWLYRIATNVCLTAAEQRGRRPLPSGLGGPSPAGAPLTEGIRWLGPLPDDPAAVASARAGLRLALVAALQHLPGRQRAVLILRDVLGWPAAEVAELLGTSTVAVKSALQRARERLGALGLAEDAVPEPGPDDLLDRYVAAFAAADIPALTALLRADATLEMPPYATWFAGRDDVLAFLAARMLDGRVDAVATAANGQPAVAIYLDGRAHGIQVLDVRGGLVAGIVVFLDPDLFPLFGLAGSSAPPAGSVRHDPG
jgi:RNA polymerase sigma-70 factor (ECF subfamily)